MKLGWPVTERPICPGDPDGVHLYRIGEDHCAHCSLRFDYVGATATELGLEEVDTPVFDDFGVLVDP